MNHFWKFKGYLPGKGILTVEARSRIPLVGETEKYPTTSSDRPDTSPPMKSLIVPMALSKHRQNCYSAVPYVKC